MLPKSSHLKNMVVVADSVTTALTIFTPADDALLVVTTFGVLKALLSTTVLPFQSEHPTTVLVVLDGVTLSAHILPVTSHFPAGSDRLTSVLSELASAMGPAFVTSLIDTPVPLTPSAGVVAVIAASTPSIPPATATRFHSLPVMGGTPWIGSQLTIRTLDSGATRSRLRQPVGLCGHTLALRARTRPR